MSEISNIEEISTKEEAQEFVEQEARKLLKPGMEKLRSALANASKPKEVLDLFDKVRSYAQVRQTSDNSAVTAGFALGAGLSGQAIAGVFQGLAGAFGIETDAEIPERDVSEDLAEIEKMYEEEINEELEKREKEETMEKVEKLEITEDEDEQDQINDFSFGT